MIITPTNGRVVWYTPCERDTAGEDGMKHFGAPLTAHIVAVWGDRMVNLTVFDGCGTPFRRLSVTLVQPGDPKPESGRYCEWMPYQMGQAKKTEEAEAKLAAA
jgi:hypothetical protein